MEQTWTEVNDLNQGRQRLSSSSRATNTASICFGELKKALLIYCS